MRDWLTACAPRRRAFCRLAQCCCPSVSASPVSPYLLCTNTLRAHAKRGSKHVCPLRPKSRCLLRRKVEALQCRRVLWCRCSASRRILLHLLLTIPVFQPSPRRFLFRSLRVACCGKGEKESEARRALVSPLPWPWLSSSTLSNMFSWVDHLLSSSSAFRYAASMASTSLRSSSDSSNTSPCSLSESSSSDASDAVLAQLLLYGLIVVCSAMPATSSSR
eukprot:scaffold888_cov246-Pinguiococcus_pyrenoidosus.AAC.10